MRIPAVLRERRPEADAQQARTDFPRTLYKARREAGLTWKQLAERIGINQALYRSDQARAGKYHRSGPDQACGRPRQENGADFDLILPGAPDFLRNRRRFPGVCLDAGRDSASWYGEKGKGKGEGALRKIVQKAASACFALALAANFCGCAGVCYKGKIFPALPPDFPVAVYHSARNVPASFRIIGHGEFTAPPEMTSAEILDLFRKTARARGSDAFLVTGVKRIPAGEARADQVENAPPVDLWPVDDSSSANQYQLDTILYSSGSDPELILYKTRVRASFLRGPAASAAPRS